MGGLTSVTPLALVAGWLTLQVVALIRFRGGWRVAAWVPAFAMGAALAIALLGVAAGSNLAPIWVFLAFPLCLGWLLLLWAVRGMALVAARRAGVGAGPLARKSVGAGESG